MFDDLKTALRPALALTLLFAAVLGIAYPLALTGIAQLAFPHQANGSLVVENNRVVGSALIGQAFASPAYFHGRPSAAGDGYDALASSGSILGPNSRALTQRVRADVAAYRTSPDVPAPPADLVTTSASGLDPHISPEAAFYQVDRVSRARRLAPASVRRLTADHTGQHWLGILGEPRVNVLALNLALDRMSAQP